MTFARPTLPAATTPRRCLTSESTEILAPPLIRSTTIESRRGPAPDVEMARTKAITPPAGAACATETRGAMATNASSAHALAANVSRGVLARGA